MEEISRPRRAPFGSSPTVGEAGRATQQRILGAAAAAFEELGYAATSVEAITDRAGCSRPTFYQYFAGKDDLHRRLAGRMGLELAAQMDRLGTVGADRAGRDTLREWLGGLADVYRRYRAVAVNFTAAARTDELMVTGAADLSVRYTGALARALGDAADALPPGLVAAANSMAYGASAHREHFVGVDPERLADALADLLHRVFFGPRPDINLTPHRPSVAPPPARTEPTPDGEVPRRARGVQTRQRLLDAAYTTFSMLGFEATRVDDIATEAGLSHGTFYRYFGDKEAAFRPLLRASTTELVELVAALGPEADFDRWAADYYEFLTRHGGIVAVWLEATTAGVESAVLARQALAASLGRALTRRSFGDADADTVALLSLLEGVPGVHYTYGSVSVDQARDATGRLLRAGFFTGV